MLKNGMIIDSTYQVICKINEVDNRLTYKARHLKMQCDVAIRQLACIADGAKIDADAVKIIENISSKFMPRIFDIIKVDEEIYSIEEFKNGIPLSNYVFQAGRMDYREVYKALKQLTEALECLHAQVIPVTHANIVPENILYDPNTGDFSLLNLDVAKAIGLSDYQPSGSFAAGFWAPEQYLTVSGQDTYPINPATDIYCLGCIMYFMLTGYSPDARYENIVPLKSLELGCKEGMIQLVNKMMAYQPDMRYQNAMELDRAISECYKMDKRYRGMCLKRKMTAISATFLLLSGIGCILFGIFKNKADIQNYYDSHILQVDQYVAAQDYYEARDIILDLEELYPDHLDLFKRDIEYMYLAKDYANCISRAENIIRKYLPKEIDDEDKETVGSFYHVLAQAYYRVQNYTAAQEDIELALSYYDGDYEFHRDYCLILIEQNMIDKAKGQLSVSKDLDWDLLDYAYVEARMAYTTMDYSGAVEKYLQVINETQDEEKRKEAYSNCADAYDSMMSYGKEIDLLNQAMAEYPDEQDYQFKTAEAYMAWGEDDTYNAETYYREALSLFEALRDDDPEDYSILDNIVILYRNLGENANAEKLLLEAEEQFRDEYRVYMWLSYIEDEKQDRLPEESRNYFPMEKYYKKAKQLYSSSLKDYDMEDLGERMDEIKEEGWLKT